MNSSSKVFVVVGFIAVLFFRAECKANVVIETEQNIVNQTVHWQISFNSLPEEFQYEIQSMGYYGHSTSQQIASNLWDYLLSVRGMDSLKDTSTVFICIQVDRHHKVQLRVDFPCDSPIFTWG